MLPFLSKSRITTSIGSKRVDSNGKDVMHPAQAILDAIKEGRPERLEAALRTLFERMEAEPHEEGPNEDGEPGE